MDPSNTGEGERENGLSLRPWSARDRLHVLLLLAVTCMLWLPRLRGPIDLRYDAGVYYVLGTSLAEGRGYRMLNEPGEIEAIQYPPLLPAYVALHQLVLGSHDPLVVGQALRWSSLLVSLGYAACAYALARRLLAPTLALFASSIAVLYFHTLYLEDLCFAEVPFALVTLAFLLASGSRRVALRAASYPLAAAAFFLRTAGIALFAAWMLEALVRRRWKALSGRALCSAACVLAWQGYVSSVVSAPEYRHPSYEYQRASYQFYNVSYAENVSLLDPFTPEKGRATAAALAARTVTNLPRLVVGLGESVSAPRGFWEWPLKRLSKNGPPLPLSLVLLPLATLGAAVILGLLLLALDGELLLVFFVACSLGLISITPWPVQFPRYMAPLAPLLAIALASSLAAALSFARWLALGLGALVLAMQAFTLRQTFSAYHHSIQYLAADGTGVDGSLFFFDEPAAWRQFYAALWWLRANTAQEAVVASSAPHLIWLHAGRKAVLPPLEVGVEEAERLLEASPVDHVVIDDLHFLDISRRYAEPAIRAHPERWEAVYRDSGGMLTIYRRRR